MTPETSFSPELEPKRRPSWGWGLILIAIGLFNLSGDFFPWADLGRFVMPILAAGFLLTGLFSRDAGWFIPAGILGGIGTGVLLISGPLSDLTGQQTGGIFLLSMGLGWATIPLLSRLVSRTLVLWPFIPAGIMTAIGSALLIGGLALNLLSAAGQAWPFILIGLGLLIVLRNIFRTQFSGE
jgi:hypothetical protein